MSAPDMTIEQALNVAQKAEYSRYDERYHHLIDALKTLAPAVAPKDYRSLTGCTHALGERCGSCMCPTCGAPAARLTLENDKAVSIWVPLDVAVRAVERMPGCQIKE